MKRRKKKMNFSRERFLQKFDNKFYSEQTNIENELLNKIAEYLSSEIEFGASIIYMGYFGSTLYGTAIKGSDIDIRGVFVPTLESAFKYPYSTEAVLTLDYTSTTGAQYDITLWSIWKFISMLLKCDTNAVENIFQSDFTDKVIYTTPFYKELANRVKRYGHVINSRYLEYITKTIAKHKDNPSIYLTQRDLKTIQNIDRILEEYINYTRTGKLLPLSLYTIQRLKLNKEACKSWLEKQDLNLLGKWRNDILDNVIHNLNLGNIDQYLSEYNEFEHQDLLELAYRYQLTFM